MAMSLAHCTAALRVSGAWRGKKLTLGLPAADGRDVEGGLLDLEHAQQRGLVWRQGIPRLAHRVVRHQLHHTLKKGRSSAESHDTSRPSMAAVRMSLPACNAANKYPVYSHPHCILSSDAKSVCMLSRVVSNRRDARLVQLGGQAVLAQ